MPLNVIEARSTIRPRGTLCPTQGITNDISAQPENTDHILRNKILHCHWRVRDGEHRTSSAGRIFLPSPNRLRFRWSNRRGPFQLILEEFLFSLSNVYKFQTFRKYVLVIMILLYERCDPDAFLSPPSFVSSYPVILRRRRQPSSFATIHHAFSATGKAIPRNKNWLIHPPMRITTLTSAQNPQHSSPQHSSPQHQTLNLPQRGNPASLKMYRQRSLQRIPQPSLGEGTEDMTMCDLPP